mgnify:CR=1 FL=1
MNDYIIRGTAANDQVRFFAAYTKDVVETARQKHNTSPVATAALGRLLTAGAMMGSMCKNDSDVITLQIQCSGPIGGLTVTADSKANVKGYVNNPDVMLPPSKEGKLDVEILSTIGNPTINYSLLNPNNEVISSGNIDNNKIQIDINEDMERMKNRSSSKVAIYNQTGSLMKQVSMANKTISINTTEFPNGIYFIHLMDNTGEKIGSKKISISH